MKWGVGKSGAILPSEPPGWTRNQVSDKWPEDARCARPGADRLLDALHRGARTGTWIEEGQGIRGSPYRSPSNP